VNGQCAIQDCDGVAEVVIGDPQGGELEVCRTHWHDALDRSHGVIRGVRLIRKPSCFLSGCTGTATSAIEDSEGLPRPVCAQHWSDLSWVGHPPPSRVGAALGWSRG
jgi:hypothetical protein